MRCWIIIANNTAEKVNLRAYCIFLEAQASQKGHLALTWRGRLAVPFKLDTKIYGNKAQFQTHRIAWCGRLYGTYFGACALLPSVWNLHV